MATSKAAGNKAKLADFVNPKDPTYGAIGDGTTDDSAAITSTIAASAPIYLPSATFNCTSIASNAINAKMYGVGQVKDSSGNKRAPYFSAISAAPATTGTHTSIETAYNGDLSRMQEGREHRITGTATLGQPTSGYLYTPEAYARYGWLYSSSGWNESTSSTTGRTAAVFDRVKVYNAGQGDAVAFNASCFVTGTRAGSTSFLANPAVSIINGDLTTDTAGTYLNPGEWALNDGGVDCSGIGWVVNLTRSVATGAKGAWWAGFRVQSKGAEEIDVAFSAYGPANIGLDLSFLTLPSSGTYNSSAITLKAGQRVYMNVSATDSTSLSRFPAGLGTGEYFEYSSGISGFNFVVSNGSVLQLVSNQVTLNQNANLSSGKVLKVNGTQVLTARQTGWAATTGTLLRTDFGDASLSDTSQALRALITDLKTHGVIGA